MATATQNPKTVSLRVDGETPWMGLPSVKNPGDISAQGMLETAGLTGWDVRLEEVVTPVKVDKKAFEVIRTDPADNLPHRLSIVGERFTVVQNEELASMCDAITDGGARLDVAGHYSKGRRVFLVFSLGDNIVLDPNGSADEIGRWLTLTAGTDGTAGIVAVTNNLRIACQNQLTANKASALSTFKMRHTASVTGRILDARKSLGIAFKQSDVFEQEMNALIETEMSKQKFWKVVESIFPKPENDVKGSVKKWEDKTDTIMGLWSGATNANLEDSAYKAYNALNEHLLWYSTVRAGNTEGALVKASGLDETTRKANLSLYKKVLLATA